ncbi:MAG: hypothetical protein WAL52_11920 [Candidatus Sulfotelmatobacter sp.]
MTNKAVLKEQLPAASVSKFEQGWSLCIVGRPSLDTSGAFDKRKSVEHWQLNLLTGEGI